MITKSPTDLYLNSSAGELRRIEFKTRRLIDADLLGRYRSAFRGTGLLFADLREYTPGDDTRHIHWKVTARTGKAFVKSFEEDRQLRIVLAVDVSSSTGVGVTKTKHQKALEFSALVSMLGRESQDAVGLCLFSDQVEEFYPPKRARSQFKRITSTLLKERELKRGTDIASALRFLIENQRRTSIVFVVSDFLSPSFSEELLKLSYKHDVIGVLVEDDIDSDIPDVGIVEFTDAESGKKLMIDASSKKFRETMSMLQRRRALELVELFGRSGADFITIKDNLIRPLAELMQSRTRRH